MAVALVEAKKFKAEAEAEDSRSVIICASPPEEERVAGTWKLIIIHLAIDVSSRVNKVAIYIGKSTRAVEEKAKDIRDYLRETQGIIVTIFTIVEDLHDFTMSLEVPTVRPSSANVMTFFSGRLQTVTLDLSRLDLFDLGGLLAPPKNVFLSHDRLSWEGHRGQLHRLKSKLESFGATVFIDDDIKTEGLTEALGEAVKSADVMVIMLTSVYCAKLEAHEDTYIKSEATMAYRQKRTRLHPVRVDTFNPWESGESDGPVFGFVLGNYNLESTICTEANTDQDLNHLARSIMNQE